MFKLLSIAIRNKNNKFRAKLFKVRRELENNYFIYWPLARWMRYKIYVNESKVFDHIYDAQSQSFDYNECQILDYAVERAIYQGMKSDTSILKEKIEERLKTKKLSDDEINWVNSSLKFIYVLTASIKQLSNNYSTESHNAILKDITSTQTLYEALNTEQFQAIPNDKIKLVKDYVNKLLIEIKAFPIGLKRSLDKFLQGADDPLEFLKELKRIKI